MSRYIDDISSIFRVSGLLDTKLANESRMKEKSENFGQYRRYIADILVIYQYIGQYIIYKCNAWNKTQNFTILANISVDIDDISPILAKKGNFVAKVGYPVWYSA